MNGDLRNRLGFLNKAFSDRVTPEKSGGTDVQDILDGRILNNDDGSCFVREREYHHSYLYGGHALGDVLGIKNDVLKRICRDTESGVRPADLLFLDTETTGLSGGTGTVAFLIGAGFFKGGSFFIRQYFMRDYDEEPAMLRAFNELLGAFKCLVTFNGKAFDWNILQTRFVFSRIKPAVRDPVNIDLLFPSRRIWKLKLESCRLVSLEENVLGEHRAGDVPGEQIPEMYFKYLDNRDAEPIRGIMDHNEKDVLSMVSLLAKIGALIENPLGESDGCHELLGVGGIYETAGEHETTVSCYENCLEAHDYYIRDTASKRLVRMYKRNKEYKKVMEHCSVMLSGQGPHNIPALVELAKIYEHREKDIQKAIEATERAIRESVSAGLGGDSRRDDLKKRLARLRAKAPKG